MFRRIILEDWAAAVPFVSFFFIFGVFTYATIRALRLAEKNREHLASLPLESPEDTSASPHTPI
jgi:hypothetical protein